MSSRSNKSANDWTVKNRPGKRTSVYTKPETKPKPKPKLSPTGGPAKLQYILRKLGL